VSTLVRASLIAALSLGAWAGCAETEAHDMPAGPTDSGPSDAEARLARLTTGGTDFVNPFEGELTPLRRGEYLVRHVAVCMECHTPRAAALAFDEARLLSGVEDLLDMHPDNELRGAMHGPNLTPDPETGLGDWTDAEVKAAILDGVSRDGTPLHPLMPSSVYHLMTDADADSIVAFLRSIPAVSRSIPHHQPIDVHPRDVLPPVPADAVPQSTLDSAHPDYASAQRGQYLASGVALCMYCHTEPPAGASGTPLMVDKLFMGRRPWQPVALGALPGPNVGSILTKNLTPTDNGLADWTADDVAAAIRWGRDPERRDLCYPMPYGPEGSYGLMLERDARDIGVYLTTLPPRDNGEFEPCCSACHGAGDAGLPTLDAGAGGP